MPKKKAKKKFGRVKKTDFIGGKNIPKKMDAVTKFTVFEAPDALRAIFTGESKKTLTPREQHTEQINAKIEKKRSLDNKQSDVTRSKKHLKEFKKKFGKRKKK
jgi:hypothetical protein